VEVGSVSKVKISKENIYGWEGYRLSIGDISLGITPQIGGRIISLTFEGEELFFVQPEHQGEVIDLENVNDLRTKKKELGFRLWGGDKTWVAPQSKWWDKIPPLDLDAGQYNADVRGSTIKMTSPLCHETGLRIIREVILNDDGSIQLNQTFRNESDKSIHCGIWDVTQVLRPFDVYLPAQTKQIRAYRDEGLVEDAESKKTQQGSWVKISCDDATQFKLGGLINQGKIIALRKGKEDYLCFERTFSINNEVSYAHDAIAEIYNSPAYNYLEIEVHAPFIQLAEGEQTTHRQIWKISRVKDHTNLI